MLRSMIERHYGQRQIAEGFFNAPIEDWWEPWMKKVDEILDDEELINTVYEALRRRHPQSATRGRMGTPAEIVIRLMVLKHVRGWSYETLECEVRATPNFCKPSPQSLTVASKLSDNLRIANQEQLERLKRGVEEWNKWRSENEDVVVDL